MKRNDPKFVDSIISEVLNFFGVSMSLVLNTRNNRQREYVNIRQVMLTMVYEYSSLSLSSIGNILNKDHATVIHSVMVVKNYEDTNYDFRSRMKILRSRIDSLIVPEKQEIEIIDQPEILICD